MEVTAKELRGKPGQIIDQVAKGIEVIVTLRGKKMAKLIPYENESKLNIEEDDIFGLWADKDNVSVEDQVRQLRKGRKF